MSDAHAAPTGDLRPEDLRALEERAYHDEMGRLKARNDFAEQQKERAKDAANLRALRYGSAWEQRHNQRQHDIANGDAFPDPERYGVQL